MYSSDNFLNTFVKVLNEVSKYKTNYFNLQQWNRQNNLNIRSTGSSKSPIKLERARMELSTRPSKKETRKLLLSRKLSMPSKILSMLKGPTANLTTSFKLNTQQSFDWSISYPPPAKDPKINHQPPDSNRPIPKSEAATPIN